MKQELREKDDQIRALEEKREQEIKALRKNSDRAMKEIDKQDEGQAASGGGKFDTPTPGPWVRFLQLQYVPNRCTPPVCFTMNNFNKLKTDLGDWTSPDLYTHEGGYKIYFRVIPNSVLNSNAFVYPSTKSGEFDDQLKWPVKATFTLQLLNQHRDQDHITKTVECQWSKPTIPTSDTSPRYTFPHADLEWNDHKQTQFLKNDCLVFRLTKVELKK